MVEEEQTTVTPVAVGDPVKIVDETYGEHVGLVTAVHGVFGSEANPAYVPCLNVVYVTTEAGKKDPYGNQIERLGSLVHYRQTSGMPRPGRYWQNL